ncbi:hypothetical protein EJ08DRAFT_273824 [Tothia fuscella]|uniref:Uncharacterized protein n=1 Tax=Tothia fuscella TaxID=1048955 RepID=A0A9P4TY48_9PEZI|nr:hypothetical protein EJ08DRAFT_273824 [Tothia fuscella]
MHSAVVALLAALLLNARLSRAERQVSDGGRGQEATLSTTTTPQVTDPGVYLLPPYVPLQTSPLPTILPKGTINSNRHAETRTYTFPHTTRTVTVHEPYNRTIHWQFGPLRTQVVTVTRTVLHTTRISNGSKAQLLAEQGTGPHTFSDGGEGGVLATDIGEGWTFSDVFTTGRVGPKTNALNTDATSTFASTEDPFAILNCYDTYVEGKGTVCQSWITASTSAAPSTDATSPPSYPATTSITPSNNNSESTTSTFKPSNGDWIPDTLTSLFTNEATTLTSVITTSHFVATDGVWVITPPEFTSKTRPTVPPELTRSTRTTYVLPSSSGSAKEGGGSGRVKVKDSTIALGVAGGVGFLVLFG